MRAAGARSQPVQAVAETSSTSVSALGSPGSSTACNWPRRLMIRLRTTVGNSSAGSTGRPRQIRLAHQPVREQRLIARRAPRGAP